MYMYRAVDHVPVLISKKNLKIKVFSDDNFSERVQ